MKYYWLIDNGSNKAESLKKILLNIIPKDWIQDFDKSEFIFVIGGDGTFLRNKKYYKNKKIIAINGGNLGFYSYFSRSNIKDIIHKIENEKNFIKTSEIQIECNQKKYSALNEVLIRSNKVLQTKVYLDSILLQNFKGSGLMFATQHGSTAHSKNANGAIIGPNLKVFQLLEIEPLTQKKYNSLHSSLILESSTTIKLKSKVNNEAMIIIDGEVVNEIFNNECVIKMVESDFLMFKPDTKKEYWSKIRRSFIRD